MLGRDRERDREMYSLEIITEPNVNVCSVPGVLLSQANSVVKSPVSPEVYRVLSELPEFSKTVRIPCVTLIQHAIALSSMDLDYVCT